MDALAFAGGIDSHDGRVSAVAGTRLSKRTTAVDCVTASEMLGADCKAQIGAWHRRADNTLAAALTAHHKLDPKHRAVESAWMLANLIEECDNC